MNIPIVGVKSACYFYELWRLRVERIYFLQACAIIEYTTTDFGDGVADGN